MANEQDQLKQQEQMTQLISSLLNPSAGSSTAKGMTEGTSIEALFGGLMQGESENSLDSLLGSNLGIGSNLGAPDETTLVAVLNQQFQALCNTLIAIKSTPLAQSQPETLRNLESYLAYAQIEIEALEPAPLEYSELAPLNSTAIAPPPKKTFKLGRIKGWQIALCGAAVCLPLALKLGVPVILSSRQVEPLLASSHSDMDHVLSVQGDVLTIQQSGEPPQAMRLAGIAPASERWQAEANGVISMLLESSHGQVSVESLGQTPSDTHSAIIKLPNGTTLQEILLKDGVAKLDSDSLETLSPDVATTLKQAEALAQSQHKNIWSPESTQ